MEPSVEASKKAFAELSQPTENGVARRKLLQDGMQGTAHEFLAVGVEMNHHYNSTAVYLSDEGPRPPLPEDPVLHYSNYHISRQQATSCMDKNQNAR
jgi:hypothetical protein